MSRLGYATTLNVESQGVERHDLADRVAGQLSAHFSGPFLGTPDGLQAPLLASLSRQGLLENVVREDIAIGMAAGACLAGRSPVVLMQNSGLGASVNALASLVVPYHLSMLLIIGMRGTETDQTTENVTMGRVTIDVLRSLAVPALHLTSDRPEHDIAAAAELVATGATAALLIRPSLFGWSPSR